MNRSQSYSSDDYSGQQQHRSDNKDQDEPIQCPLGSRCNAQENAQHCSKYSHPSEPKPQSSVYQDEVRKPCPSGTVCSYRNNADHRLQYSHPDEQRQKPKEVDMRQKQPCPYGFQCGFIDAQHLAMYSHFYETTGTN